MVTTVETPGGRVSVGVDKSLRLPYPCALPSNPGSELDPTYPLALSVKQRTRIDLSGTPTGRKGSP